ncbi:MAG: hypothetical protein ACFFCS_12290 [Candidatus Hodarchaeota archaeon]
MKINPFKAIIFDDYFIFNGKRDFMCLKLFPLMNEGAFMQITDILKEDIFLSQNEQFCIQINYNGTEKHFIFSINFVKNEIFSDFESIDNKFEEINEKFDKYCLKKQNPKKIFYNFFSGNDNFKLQQKGNQLLLKEPGMMKELLNIANFEINLYNLELAPNFFIILDDLAIKMGLNLDIFIFIKNENNTSKLKAFLLYREQNSYKFTEIIEKLENINEFKVMLEKRIFSRRLMASFFFRRLIMSSERLYSNDVKQFIIDYFNPVSPIKDIGNISEENQDKLIDRHLDCVDEIEGLNLNMERIGDNSNAKFKEYCCNYPSGKFLDSRKLFFDTGDEILVLIQKLNISVLTKFFRIFSNKRILKLIFVYKEELQELLKYMKRKKDNLYELVSLDELCVPDNPLLIH